MLNKILGALMAIFMAVSLFLRGSLHKEKAKSAERDRDLAKAAEAAGDAATEALVRGVIRENIPAKRGHFNK